MPLLPPEPFLHPPDMFVGEPASPTAADVRWWVLHTRPRAEKTLARRLLARDVGFFLPCYRRQWRSRGRVHESYLPLFTSYLFLRGCDQVRLFALQTNLIVHCLNVPDQGQLRDDLRRVQGLIESDAPLTPEDRLEPGSPVEIVSGPLAGLTGTVIRRGKQLKLFVEVQFLQRGVSVEVETWMIQPLDTARLTAAAHDD